MAVFDKRAAFAGFGENGRRSGAPVEKKMHPGRKRFGSAAQCGREFDRLPPTRGAVVNSAFGDGAPQHLFETEGLRAELNVVGLASCLVAAPFVFDGKRRPQPPMTSQRDAGGRGLEFYDIGLTRQSEA